MAGFITAPLVGGLMGPLPAAGDETRHRPGHQQTGTDRTIEAEHPELHPEGVAWDPTREAFLVGSALHGNIVVVHTDGTTEELVPSLGPVSTLGIRVDEKRGRILVAYSDFWVRQRLDTGQPPTSGVAAFDLATGDPLFDTDVAVGRDRTFANDLTHDDQGNVYVTDSVSATIYRIDTHGNRSPLVYDRRFAADVVGLNGIAWHPDGYLLVARYDNGRLFRVEPVWNGWWAKVTEVRMPRPMIGTDGIRLRPDGSLYVVTNDIGANVGAPGGVDAVTVLRSKNGWRSARIDERHEPWEEQGPTNIALAPSGDYVLSGDVSVLMTGGTSNEFVLRRL